MSTDAEARVREFLRQRALSRHHDPVDITGIQMERGVPMAYLKVTDLEEILDELAQLREVVEATQT